MCHVQKKNNFNNECFDLETIDLYCMYLYRKQLIKFLNLVSALVRGVC